jgi:SAM-dependent methyltransferase
VSNVHLDDPGREAELRKTIERKPALRRWYVEIYQRYCHALARCPARGVALELGSGAGFAKKLVPGLTTSDVLPYQGVDLVVDATRMQFSDGELRFICMLNVFHHIPDVAAFFREAERCLMPNGRILIVDQHPGWFSTPVLKYAHHEPFRPEAKEWRFESTGPLSGANGALAWIVFQRDRAIFKANFPALAIESYETHSPLHYFLAGGLKSWSLIPDVASGVVAALDRALLTVSPNAGSFVDIHIRRR